MLSAQEISVAVLNARIETYKRNNPEYSLPPHYKTMAEEMGAFIDFSGDLPVARAVTVTGAAHARNNSEDTIDSDDDDDSLPPVPEEIIQNAIIEAFEQLVEKKKASGSGMLGSRWASK